MACTINFQGSPYTEEQFAKALKKGLLFNLIDRNVIDLPINIGDLGTSTKGFEQHFVSTKEDIKKSMMDIFQLPEDQATAISEVYDRVAFAWASRHNSTREKFYKTLTVFKGDEAALKGKEDVKNQIIGEKGVKKLNDTIKTRNLKLAKQLDKEGKLSALEIYHATGFEKMDNVWKTEIGYGKVSNTEAHALREDGVLQLGDFFNAPELYKAYPSIKKILVLTNPDETGSASFNKFEDGSRIISLNPSLLNENDNKRVFTLEGYESLVHEIQHAVQDKEGLLGNMDSEKLRELGIGYYIHAPKEEEAENAAFRSMFTKETSAQQSFSQTLLFMKAMKGELDDETLYQNAQAAVQISKDGRAIIYSLSNPNVSSPLHELAHIWESQLRPNETQEVIEWAGQDEWTRETSEKFARGFEKYLADGNAPTPLIKGLFEQFKDWLTNIYKGIIGSEIDLELNDAMKTIYAKMLGEHYKTATEQAVASEKLEAGKRDMRPDTMERRKNEYVEPVVIDKEGKLKRQLDLLNLPDKHLHPIDPDTIDFYGWASQIQTAMRSGTYVDAISRGELTEEQLTDILKSMKWMEDKEASDRMAVKNVENIMFKVNELGTTFSIEGLIGTNTNDPSFQNLANHFIKTDRLKDEINNGNITYEQAKVIVDNAISQDVETRDKKEQLQKEIDEKVGKEKKAKKVIKEKIIKEEIKKEDLVEEAQKEEITPTLIETVADVTPEPVATTEPVNTILDPNTNIDSVDNFDNSKSFYIRDNNGDVIMNDAEQSIDGSYDTFEEAEAALNNINNNISPTTEPKVEEPTISETPKVENTTNKYSVGDKVSSKGKNGVITDIDEDGYARLEDGNGGFVGFSSLAKLSDPVEEVIKETPKSEIIEVSDTQIKEDRDKKDMLERVAERMQKIMPSLDFETGYFIGEWKGRIKDGKIQVNLKNATLDTPIHEFMHPFVLALRLQNYELYSNLMDELRYGALSYYIDEVGQESSYSNLTYQEIEEEALVRYLAEDMQTVFTERGHIDKDAMEERRNSFLSTVYEWFKKIWEKLFSVDRQAAGAKNGTINAMNRITYSTKTGKLTGYKAGAAEGVRSFVINDITDKSKLDARNISDATVKEILEKSVGNEVTTLYVKDLSTIKEKKKVDPNEIALMDVSEFPVNITLKELSDFLIGQEKIGIDLSAVQTSIDKLEAYQVDTQKEANDILEGIKKRLNGFADEAGRRIANAQVLPNQVAEVKRILRDYDGVEGVAEYLRQGMEGLNLAYRMVRYIQEDLDNDRAARTGSGGFAQGQLTQSDINGLNRDLAEVRSLLGFYSDISDLYKVYGDQLDKDEVKAFEKLFARAELRKKSIAGIATDLQAKWLFPYLEEAQRNLPDEKKLTFEKFKRNLRFVDQDASSVSYWLGASINSRDPLTAILAVALKDKLNQHHNEEIDKLNLIKTTFDKWLTRTGTPNKIGAIEDYYKKNYLRQAKVWETRYMDALATSKVGDKVSYDGVDGVITEIENGKAKLTGYANRWAFHEEYYMDLYHDDLRKFTESLPQPSTGDEWDAYNKRVKDWVYANDPTVTKNAKYRNPEFTRISSDDYFQVLYNTYKESNAKYGERQLLYGIVPQAYRTKTLLEKGKAVITGAKNIGSALSNKDNYTLDNASQAAIDAANYVFDEDEYMKAKDLNLDGSYYRGVKSPFTHLINQDNLDLRLNESVYGFHSSANTFATLREVQGNVENLKMLIEGNPAFRIEARKIALSDKTGRTVFDRFLGRPQSKEARDVKINNQLVEFINDTFYGEDTFQASVKVGKVNISLNKLGTNLGFFTALSNMAGNVFAGVSNVTIGNVMSLGEAVGGKYYSVKDWGKGLSTYLKSTPEFMADSFRPVKSKITQLGILYDAIQGEFRDKYGKNISGNIAQRYASSDTFFIINHVAEHQIQLTGMLALMNATKVKLKDGKEVSLYDAYEKNSKGFYKLRPDAIWTLENENEFTRRLHGISKDLNGNYAAFDKGTIQRHWWGKLAIQYRKYLYPAWRSRFAGERVDYERGEVIEGYYRTFLKKLYGDIKDYKFNLIKLGAAQWNKEGWTAEQKYAHRKTMFDLGIVLGTTMIATALAGMEAGDDDKNKWAKNALMLQMLRLRFDLSQFNISIIPEVMQQIKNPSASLNTLTDWGQFIQQLSSPTEIYSQNSGYHEKGDSKLGAKFAKVVPLYRQYLRFMKPEEAVKYFNLINSNVKKNDDNSDTEDSNK